MKIVMSTFVTGLFLFGLVATSLAEEPVNAYDSKGRIVSSHDENGTVKHYVYDKDGKRTTLDSNGQPVEATGPANTVDTEDKQSLLKSQ